jgi:tetratricopeptide (TPR) repeat protein
MNKFRYLLMLIVFVSIVPYGCSGEVDKAKEFIKAGMYPQAIEVLNKQIEKEPTDAEAQFQLGICFINTGDFSNANERFNSAVKLQSEYGFQIGSEYKKFGDEALAKNNFAGARQAYSQAIGYQPDLKGIIINGLKEGGIKNLNKQTLNTANEQFDFLYSLDKGSGILIAKAYLDAFNQSGDDDEFKAVVINRAVTYSQSVDIIKTHADYFFVLSKKATSTEEAVADLVIANKFSQTYSAELQTKKEALEYEKMLELVKKNEEKFGKAQHIRLDKPDELKQAAEFSTAKKVYYFSLEDFRITDGINFTRTWSKFYSKIGEIELSIKGEGKVKLNFIMDKKPTDVYFWVSDI